MKGLLQNQPLSLSSLLRHAERFHSDTEIVSRMAEAPIHREKPGFIEWHQLADSKVSSIRYWMIGLLVSLFASTVPVKAQDQLGDHGFRHSENHEWYKDLRQPGTGYSCCNGTNGKEGDCRPTRAYWDDNLKAWKARIDGNWIMVPPRVVLDSKLNKQPLEAHICASLYANPNYPIIYCFLPGADGS